MNLSILLRPPIFLAIVSLIAVSPVYSALPSIDNLSIDPPPSGDWIIGSTTTAPGVATVRIRYDAVVTGQGCNSYTSFGWMVRNQCQNVVRPPRVMGAVSSVNAACIGPTSENPVTTGKIDMLFSVARNANGAPLVLCAQNAAGENSSVSYRVSYGQPVKAVKIPKATFSSKGGFLRIQGKVVPKGNTNLNNAEVLVFDDAGKEIATGYVNKKKFDLRVPMDVPPASVTAKVVNTVSPVKAVKFVQ